MGKVSPFGDPQSRGRGKARHKYKENRGRRHKEMLARCQGRAKKAINIDMEGRINWSLKDGYTSQNVVNSPVTRGANGRVGVRPAGEGSATLTPIVRMRPQTEGIRGS